jgi:SWIM/SEC-C metal-binding protein
MAKLGSEKKPVIARVHTEEKAQYVAQTCAANGWHYIIDFELPSVPEDISDLEKLLHPELLQAKSTKIARNSSCPCGSGKKYKKCCAETDYIA